MAYTPVDGGNIIANFVTEGVYTPVDGSNIIANFSSPVYHRALLLRDGLLRQITDSEIGTGRKPIKDLRGAFLVIVGADLKTLGNNEVLRV